MRRLITKEELELERTQKLRSKQTRLDRTRLALVYARQSTKDQPIKNKEAKLMQRDELVEYAVNTYQWPEDKVLLFVENELDKCGHKLDKPRAASGRLDVSFRPGLSEIQRLIEADKVGALFCRDISRLFRDEDMVNPPQFARTCKEHNVVIITYDQEFDFNATARDDLKDFLEEAQYAAEFLKMQRRTLHKAKERKGMRGEFTGHSIPTGFMLDDKRKGYLVNPYWCDTVKWLTHRFRELDADLAALHNEILGIPIFCELPEDIKQRIGRIQLTPVPGGYTIASRSALIWMLINPANIGHRVYRKRIAQKNMHSAIVDLADYEFALAHLGKVDLDGNVIEREPRARRFTRGQKRQGLLDGVRSNGRPVVTSHQGNVHVFQYTGSVSYSIRSDRYLDEKYSGSISIDVIDNLISERLEQKLNDLLVEAEDDYVERVAQGWEKLPTDSPTDAIDKMIEVERELHGRAKAIIDHISALKQQVRASMGKIDETIKDVEGKIAFKLREYEVAKHVMSDTDITQHYASLARLRTRLADLKEKRAQVNQTDRDIENVSSRLKRAKKEWSAMTLEDRRSFFRIITHDIILDALSDRWMKLTIVWSPLLAGENYTEFALLFRTKGAGANWQPHEDAVLREMYQHATRSDLLRALPHRSWEAIKMRAAIVLRIFRLTREVGDIDLLPVLSLNDVTIMREYGITEEQVNEGVRVWWGIDTVVTEKSDGRSYRRPAQ